MAKRKQQRRSPVVDAETQRRVATAVVLVPAIGLALTTGAVAVLGRRLLSDALHTDVSLDETLPLLAAGLGFFLVCCAVVAIQGLRFAQRIAGPAYRIQTSLERIRAGDLDFRVTLRRGDHLRELGEEVNRLLDWLNENPPKGARTGGDVVVVDRTGAETLDDLDLEELIAGSEPSRRNG